MPEQEIFRTALELAPEGTQQEVLLRLCRAAQQQLRGKLRRGLSPEDCADAFVLACALTAVAELPKNTDGVERFSVGEVSVTAAGGSEALRERARRLLAPYCADGFSFLGVPG